MYSGRIVGKQEVGNSDRICCLVSGNRRLVVAVLKVEFKLLQLQVVFNIEQGRSGRVSFRAILASPASASLSDAGSASVDPFVPRILGRSRSTISRASITRFSQSSV